MRKLNKEQKTRYSAHLHFGSSFNDILVRVKWGRPQHKHKPVYNQISNIRMSKPCVEKPGSHLRGKHNNNNNNDNNNNNNNNNNNTIINFI